MTHFSSDDNTIRDLEKLTQLIKDSLNKTWDPEIVIQAKNEIESITNKAREQVKAVNAQVHSIQNNLTNLSSQKAELEKAITELEKAIKVADRLDQLVGQLGGVDKLRQDLAKLESLNPEKLNQVLQKVNAGQELVVSLQQKAQELQETTTSLVKKIDNLGGENLLIEKFNQLQEIAQRLDTVDSQIQSSINSCLNQYLPDFEAGKIQIEQWRKETILETQQTLGLVNQKTQSIDEYFKKFKQEYEVAKALFNECERKELKLQSILDAITELSQSLGGEPLVSKTIKKLTDLDNFIAQEKSALNIFKKELEESIDDEIEEVTQRDEERVAQKLADLDNFVISAKSTLNNLKKQIEESLDKKSQKLVSQNLQEFTKKQDQLEEQLRDEFQSLLREEILKLETQYLQEIQRMRGRHFRLL